MCVIFHSGENLTNMCNFFFDTASIFSIGFFSKLIMITTLEFDHFIQVLMILILRHGHRNVKNAELPNCIRKYLSSQKLLLKVLYYIDTVLFKMYFTSGLHLRENDWQVSWFCSFVGFFPEAFEGRSFRHCIMITSFELFVRPSGQTTILQIKLQLFCKVFFSLQTVTFIL